MTEKHFPYRQDVIDMVTVAVQTCLLLEKAQEYEKTDFIGKLVRIMPMLYLKTIMLNDEGHEIEGFLQTFVTEEDYNFVAGNIADILGNDDSYLEVFMDDMRYSDTPITSFISENLADIYQELKDMVGNFQTGDENIMTDAVCSVLESFRTHWGQKLLNALRALHCLHVNPNEDYLCGK